MPLGQEVDHRTAAVLEECHRCQSLHQNDLVHILGLLAGHDPEHNGSLGVTNVVQLAYARGIEDVVHCGGYIMLSHLVECKVPELGMVGAILNMLSRVRIATNIGHPDIVPLIVEQVTFGTEQRNQHGTFGDSL